MIGYNEHQNLKMKLEVKNLIKNFKSTTAVNNISFKLKNSTLGLGSKWTWKDHVYRYDAWIITSSGEIFIDGVKLISETRIKLLNFMNFASPYIELPKKLTVKQTDTVRLYGVKNKDERIEELVDDLNLGKFLNKNTGELSSGQKNDIVQNL